jgi:DNA-binding HxlR family transcriptional regulator
MRRLLETKSIFDEKEAKQLSQEQRHPFMANHTTHRATWLCVSEVDLARAIFEGKWRFDVLRCLCGKPQRLSSLTRLIPGATKKMLIDTLHSLEELRWVNRVDLSDDVKRVEYYIDEQWMPRLRSLTTKIAVQSSQ